MSHQGSPGVQDHQGFRTQLLLLPADRPGQLCPPGAEAPEGAYSPSMHHALARLAGSLAITHLAGSLAITHSLPIAHLVCSLVVGMSAEGCIWCLEAGVHATTQQAPPSNAPQPDLRPPG